MTEIFITENIKAILQQCYAKNDKFNIKRFNLLKTKELDDFLVEIDAKPVELFHIFKNDMKSFPVCKTCGKRLRNDWYHKPREYCCSKCESNSPIVKDKIEKTTLKHYGVRCSLQNKEIQEKIKQTCLNKYGTEYYTQSVDYAEKYRKTCEERYGEGITNSFQAIEIKEKIKKTNLEKFGCENPQHNKEIKKRTIETFKENYTEEIANKKKETNIKKFGAKTYAESSYYKNKLKTEKYDIYVNLLKQRNLIIDMSKKEYLNSIEYSYKCLSCGTIFQSKEIYPRKIHCPKCIEEYAVSYVEKDLVDFVKSVYQGEIIENTRKVITPFELDVYIPEKKLAIEFNGDYWHSENVLSDKNYHRNKTMMCNEQNIRLIHIFEYEWCNKKEICKSLIKSALGLYDKTIYARQCTVKELDIYDYNDFLDENHLQGSLNSAIRYGLYYQNELVAVIGFGKSRFKKDDIELHRFCCKLSYHIPGAFSKLIKYSNIKHFISFIDLAHFTGNGYKSLGFKELSITEPNYKWVKGYEALNRFSTQKHKLKELLKENYNEDLTETENMEMNGYAKIYDSGNMKVEYGL